MKFVLGHGAFGSAADMELFVVGLRARGFEAEAIDLPRGRAERAVPEFVRRAGPDVIASGHSFGGRAAGLAATQAAFAGVVCFSYPLRDRPQERSAHWSRIGCPVLIVNGDRDKLCDLGELQRRMSLLREGRLEVIEGLGHDLAARLDLALDLAAQFASTLRAR